MKHDIRTSIVPPLLHAACKAALVILFIALTTVTARASWKAPEVISQVGTVNGDSPGVWIDPQGDIFVAYIANSFTWHLAVQPPGGSFGAGQLPPEGSTWNSIKMGFDTNGNAIVAWLDYNGYLYAARRTAGADGTFGAVQTVTNVAAPYTWFWLSVNPSGEAILAWYEPLDPGPGEKLMVATRPAGTTTTFGIPQTIASGDLGSLYTTKGTATFLDPDGSAAVLWVQDENPNNDTSTLEQSFKPAGAASFGTPSVIATGVDTISGGYGNANPSGYGIVTWNTDTVTSTNDLVQAAIKMPSTNFGPAFTVAGGGPLMTTRGAIGSDGRGIVTWIDRIDPNNCIGGSMRLDAAFVATNGPSSAPFSVSTDKEWVGDNGEIAVADDGNVFVNYLGDGLSRDPCSQGSTFVTAVEGNAATNILGHPEEISPPGVFPPGMYPVGGSLVVVAGPDDTAFAAWYANYGTSTTLQATTFAPSLTASMTDTNTLLISWPSAATGWQLQQNTNLATTNWTPSNYPIFTNGAAESITVTPPAGNLFFRLSKP